VRLPPAEWAVLAVGAALLFPLQAAVDVRRGEPPEVIDALPPEAVLPVLAFGHREAAADLLEIQATNFLMQRLERFHRLERDHLELLYGAVRALDPDDVDATFRGATYLSSVANRPYAALAFLDRALGLGADRTQPARTWVHPGHPRRWRLFFEKGSTYLVLLVPRAADDVERRAAVRQAGAEFLAAAEQPGVPADMADKLRRAGHDFSTRPLPRRQALEFELAEWTHKAEAADPVVRAIADRRRREVTAALRALDVQEQVDARARAGRPVSDLAELDLEPPAAEAGRLLLHQGRVVAAAYQATACEQRLQRALDVWLAGRPETPPTLGDLGVEVAPYLQAELAGGEARVRPRP